jgi:hypothetical protein
MGMCTGRVILRRSDRLWILNVVLGGVAIFLVGLVVASALPGQSVGLGAVLSGVATLVLAGLTAIIIIVNARVLQATLDEAKATREQADATREQAKLAAQSIRELQISRELDWRPFVVRFEGSSHIVKGKLLRDIAIQNIGRGPAINCLYLRQEDSPDGSIFLRTDSCSSRFPHQCRRPL